MEIGDLVYCGGIRIPAEYSVIHGVKCTEISQYRKVLTHELAYRAAQYVLQNILIVLYYVSSYSAFVPASP